MLTKFWVQEHLPLMADASYAYPYGGIGLFQNFFGIEGSIVHTTNSGAAWGFFSSFQVPLLYLRIALVVAIVVYLIVNRNKEPFLIPYALILAGAIGNILDFFFYGHVIDMMHFILFGWDYPVFNIADSAIFLGILLLLLSSFFYNKLLA